MRFFPFSISLSYSFSLSLSFLLLLPSVATRLLIQIVSRDFQLARKVDLLYWIVYVGRLYAAVTSIVFSNCTVSSSLSLCKWPSVQCVRTNFDGAHRAVSAGTMQWKQVVHAAYSLHLFLDQPRQREWWRKPPTRFIWKSRKPLLFTVVDF